jgi:hypothetical protein
MVTARRGPVGVLADVDERGRTGADCVDPVGVPSLVATVGVEVGAASSLRLSHPEAAGATISTRAARPWAVRVLIKIPLFHQIFGLGLLSLSVRLAP